MSIQSSEILFYKSEMVTDTGANGGRMGPRATALIATGVKNNLFPDPSQAERASGKTRLRKVFCAVENAENLALTNAAAHLTRTTGADDFVTLFLAGQRETQAEIGAPREYGAAVLAAPVTAGDTSMQVTLEDADLDVFQDGDSIWIGDGSNEEYFHDVTISGSAPDLTVTLAAGDQFANSFATSGAFVASLLPHPDTDLESGASDWIESSSAGTYDEGSHPLELENIGSVEDDWTLTFTTASAFVVEGVYSGALASGAIGADYAPANPEGGAFFTLRASGWAGTWAPGDTITFGTHPAAWPVWLKQVVPEGAASASSAGTGLRLRGESA
jgi:hypothetical protein